MFEQASRSRDLIKALPKSIDKLLNLTASKKLLRTHKQIHQAEQYCVDKPSNQQQVAYTLPW